MIDFCLISHRNTPKKTNLMNAINAPNETTVSSLSKPDGAAAVNVQNSPCRLLYALCVFDQLVELSVMDKRMTTRVIKIQSILYGIAKKILFM
jgi:hypothetical protein